MAGRLGAEQGAKTVSIDVVLSRRDTGGCLALASPAFSENDTLAAMPRSASTRIVQGMVRQIRGSIDFDSAARAFVIQFPLAAASEAEGK
jgi:hypothetical protein